jgi:prevent-host-death family protein
MPIIGVRELRQRATEVLRQVREQRAEYVITHQGRPIALLLPVNAEELEQAMLRAARPSRKDAWARYAEIAQQVRNAWPAGKETEDLLDEIRG